MLPDELAVFALPPDVIFRGEADRLIGFLVGFSTAKADVLVLHHRLKADQFLNSKDGTKKTAGLDPAVVTQLTSVRLTAGLEVH
jgi:hypothetical protein